MGNEYFKEGVPARYGDNSHKLEQIALNEPAQGPKRTKKRQPSQKTEFISLRVDTELARIVDRSAGDSSISRSEWMLEAIYQKLSIDTPENRLNEAIDRLESFAERLNPR
ncbi:hypothetical protein [Rosenbergiella australiborealis]|uniref:hypothetical protein n=1 Tax=Rosenbergiella australiborealis TaxID=1544696 RepID=UPI001F4E8E45|nr:hypothetical protein [Rosenbergiella australiborealis]